MAADLSLPGHRAESPCQRVIRSGFHVISGCTSPGPARRDSFSSGNSWPASADASPLLGRRTSSSDIPTRGGISSAALQSSLMMLQFRKLPARRRSLNTTPLTLSPMASCEHMDSVGDDDFKTFHPESPHNDSSMNISQLSPYPSPVKSPAIRRLSIGVPNSPRSPLCQALPNLPNNLVDFLDSMPWLEDAPIEFKSKMAQMADVRHVHTGELIIRKGEMARAVFFVARGVVEIISEDGEVVYAEIGEGSIFGEIGILYNVPRTCSCRASTSCLLLSLTKEKFISLLEERPQLREIILEDAEKRMDELKEKNCATKQVVLGREFAVSSIAESLLAIPVFSQLDRGYIYQMSLFTRVHLYQPGSTILDINCDCPCLDLFVLVRGQATLLETCKESGGMRKQYTPIMAGALFGEISVFFDHEPEDDKEGRTIVAKTACDVLILSRSCMESFLARSQDAADTIREAAYIAIQQADAQVAEDQFPMIL